MKKTALAALIASSIVSVPASAGVAEELAAMKARIAQLEAQLAEQQVAITKTQEVATANSGGFADNVSVSGALEIVANHSKEDDGNSTSDFVVDTFELEIEAEINDKVSITSLVEYNDDDGDIELSEAYAVIDAGAATITAGAAPIPVAAINDAGWTSPLTDDYFDITEGMAMVSFGNEMVAADIYSFSNDESDSINAYGVSLSVAASDVLTFGAGYVNDLGTDFDALTGADSEDAWRLNALAELSQVTLSAEYLEVSGSQNLDPTFLALNAAFDTEYATFYLGWSEVDDSAIDLERTVLGFERDFGENATVSAELVRDEEDGAETDSINVVLVTEF